MGVHSRARGADIHVHRSPEQMPQEQGEGALGEGQRDCHRSGRVGLSGVKEASRQAEAYE